MSARHALRRLLGGLVLLATAVLLALRAQAAGGARPAAAQANRTVYLPLVSQSYNPALGQRVVNARYLPGLVGPDGNLDRLSEMALFWFGRVTPSENYVDVRVGYTDSELVVYLAVFDRLLWHDTSPALADLDKWDGASLYLDLDSGGSAAPDASSYRFIAQLRDRQGRAGYQAAYQGTGSGWQNVNLNGVVTDAGCAWEDYDTGGFNNGENNRGCGITFRVPFARLGLAGRPADGAVWRLGIADHDRESQAGPALADKVWPPEFAANVPANWGRLRFGQPAYAAPASKNPQTVTIRHGLNGAVVPDANIGGIITNQCPGDPTYIWNQWGNANNHTDTGANVQNQVNIADWPCFAKYYVTFPLNGLPAGRLVRAATLRLQHTGNSGSLNDAQNSYLHIHVVADDWNESTIGWNNAPLALENVAVTVVPPLPGCDYGNGANPCAWREWDLRRAVAEAYSAGKTALRLAVYSSDGAMHSGKFIGTSDQNDFYAAARPSLVVTLVDP